MYPTRLIDKGDGGVKPYPTENEIIMKLFLRKVRPFIGLALLVLALFLIRTILKEYHYHEIVKDLFQIPIKKVFFSIALTLVSYLLLIFYDFMALRYVNHPLGYKKIALASFIGYVFSYNLTVFGGGAARYRIYSNWGVSPLNIAKIVIFCGLALWLGFFTLAGFIFVFEPLDIRHFLHIPFFTTTRPLGVFFLFLIFLYIFVIGLREKPIKIFGLELSAIGPKLTFIQIIIACLDWTLACSVLYILLPPVSNLQFMDFLGIFLLAQFAGIASQIPGGVGAFESVSLFLFSFFYPAPVVLGALLIYRVIYYLFPLTIATVMLTLNELLKNKAIKLAGTTIAQVTSTAVPHVFAFIVFLGGAVLLFSGALPAEQSRLALLRDFLPLPVLEISHFLASLIGFWLLLLARGLQLRLDAAYYLTAILLAFGAFFSLFKGLDYEEATILLAMFLVFLPCRKEFYRKSSLLSQPLTINWFVPLIIVLVGSIWLGFFSYKHVEYSNSLWWQFAYNSNASRFLRATAGILIFAVTIAVAILLRSAKKPSRSEQTSDLEKIKSIVDSSPYTYANLALLGDKTFLISSSGSAFLMYGSKGQSWIAMGDPVGPKEEWIELIWRFYEIADRHGCYPVFYEIQADSLQYYADLGLSAFKIGEEAHVPLQEFSLKGGPHRHLRYTVNALEKLGFSFKVLSVSEAASSMERFKEISDAWLKKKNIDEKGFSLGFFDEKYLMNYQAAVVFDGDKITAFANLWCGADKEEFSIDLMRYLPDSHEGIMEYLFTKLIMWGKEEGYKYFNLGMAPLSGIEDKKITLLWPRFANFVFLHGEHFYNFQGIRKYKEKFSPQWQPKYLVCPGGLAVPRVLGDIISLISEKK